MTEKEYIYVTNKQKIADAYRIMETVLPGFDGVLTKTMYKRLTQLMRNLVDEYNRSEMVNHE